MELYLIRHADAAPLGEGGITADEDRPLTDKGREQLKALASGLKRFGVILDTIMTSPLVRAKQTAEGVLENWGSPAPSLHMVDELAPQGNRRKLAKELRRHGEGSIALVGHEPDLSQFAGWLIGSRKSRLELAKGGVAHVHFDNGVGKAEGVLKWLALPEWLNADK